MRLSLRDLTLDWSVRITYDNGFPLSTRETQCSNAPNVAQSACHMSRTTRAHIYICAMQGIVVESDLTVVWM